MAPVINEVVAVPPRPSRAHLDEPRPHVLRRGPNCNRVRNGSNWVRDEFVSGKLAFPLTSVSSDGLLADHIDEDHAQQHTGNRQHSDSPGS